MVFTAIRIIGSIQIEPYTQSVLVLILFTFTPPLVKDGDKSGSVNTIINYMYTVATTWVNYFNVTPTEHIIVG